VGSRFGLSLAWVVLVGILGICVFAEMSGRVAAVSGRATFDLVRERLGPRAGLLNLFGSMAVTLLTYVAEIGGIALALELVSGVNYLLIVPLLALLVWWILWRVRFSVLENVFGMAGLGLVVFAVAVWQLGPDWGQLLHQFTHPVVPDGEGHPTYWYYAIALFGAAMTPYEVFFFSSGAVEEHWTPRDLNINRANVYIGFPLGGALSLLLMTSAALVLAPRGISVSHLSQVTLPVSVALGKIGLAVLIVGIFAATFGAALETGLSAGYSVAQFFGWQWGKFVRPAEASRFHLVVIVSLIGAVVFGLTTVDPVKVTEYSIVLAAAALPLTYFPILVIANDPQFMGDKTNSRFLNAIAGFYLILVLLVAAATIPLMIITKGGA
jgi:Mn2+/Fe2+ NRAMP family transporter